MGRTHLAITVELVSGGHAGNLWPRPGRVMIVARSTTFEQFATAIDDAFARWDRIIPDRPEPWWGWGSIPDQYGRNWNGDDGDTPAPPAPDGLTDLPPILPWWGPQPGRARTAPPDPLEGGIRYRDLIT